MPKDTSDSASRKKDKKLSSRDNLSKDVKTNEFSKKKHARKYSTDGSKSSKKSEALDHSSGRKRHFADHEDNCFASEYDDLEDSRKLIRKNARVIQQHSRNGLMLPGISNAHSLVDYDYESSDSDSSSESISPQYPTGKAARRKSAVQVVSASVKADLNDMRQQRQKSDTTISRHVRLSSSSSCAKPSSTDSVNSGERNDRKKNRHPSAELTEPVREECKTKDIPVKSPKRRHSKDHHGSKKYDNKEHELTSEQKNSRKPHSVDKPEKISSVKTDSREEHTKITKRLDSETEFVSSSVHTEKSKVHKKSKKRVFSEERTSDDDGVEHGSRSTVSKPSCTDAAAFKKEKSQKVIDDSFTQCKTSVKNKKQKKIGSDSEAIRGTKSLSRGSSSMQQDDRVLKHSSDDHVNGHKKHDKEKHTSKKKSPAVEESVGDSDKDKKVRLAVKRDSQATSGKSDKSKDKRNKDKVHHSRNEREFSDEGQISSDSSGERVKESKHKHRSHATLRNGSSTPVRSSHDTSASSKKALSSEVCHLER